MSIPGSELSGPEKRRRALHRAAVYFGLAEPDPDDPSSQAAEPVSRAREVPAADEVLRRLERKIDEQTAAIDALRAEVGRLRRHDL